MSIQKQKNKFLDVASTLRSAGELLEEVGRTDDADDRIEWAGTDLQVAADDLEEAVQELYAETE